MEAVNIYIVIGETGEYSGHREWFVCAHTAEKLAQYHVELATRRAKEIQIEQRNRSLRGAYSSEVSKNEYDEHMELDYTGTRYRYEKVRIITEGGPIAFEMYLAAQAARGE